MKKIACIVAGLFVALTMAAQTKVTWSMELGLGMSTWMGKDAGDSSPLFNQKVGVGIDVPLSGLVWTGVIPDRIVLGIEGSKHRRGLCRG